MRRCSKVSVVLRGRGHTGLAWDGTGILAPPVQIPAVLVTRWVASELQTREKGIDALCFMTPWLFFTEILWQKTLSPALGPTVGWSWQKTTRVEGGLGGGEQDWVSPRTADCSGRQVCLLEFRTRFYCSKRGCRDHGLSSHMGFFPFI